jgi:DMSO/TMAO reductase YedYZ molybdopterin-dependent catalytic subunit
LLVSPLILLFAAAYIQWGAIGLPALHPLVLLPPKAAPEPHGFPGWLRITHYVNFLFLILLIRSGLQHLTYFGVVFLLAPLAILTGPSMSPALTSRYSRYPKLPGNRQIGRSLHFLVMCSFVIFILIHVSLVEFTGFARNMNHIVLGTDDANVIGLYLGLVGIGVVAALNGLAYLLAWKHPRAVQHAAKAVVTPVMNVLLNGSAPQSEFSREDISPFFWVNGNMPTCDEWKTLTVGDFKNYRLKVSGLVENPVELSLDDLRALGRKTQITLHHCIQGWSGIAEWGGLPLKDLIQLVRPKPNAKVVCFYSFSEGVSFIAGVANSQYYESLSIENALHPQTLLAYEMNYQPLNHLHGAPLRLRVENQLGFKMVKWIRQIDFVEDVKSINKGEGGYDEDIRYFGELANV